MAQSFHTDADLTGSSDASDSSLSLGFSFMVAVPGTVTDFRYRAHSTNVTGSYEGGLYQITDEDPPAGIGDGTLLGSATFGALTAGAWNTVAAGAGIAVDEDISYRARVHTTAARYVARGNFFAAGNITRGNIRGLQDGAAPPGLTSIRNGTYFYNATPTYPQDAFNASAYFVDVVFEPDYYITRPFRVPELSNDPGLYSYGMDVTTDVSTRYLGVRYYHPPGTATADVTVRLYNTSTQAELVSGTKLAASIVDGWNPISFNTPHTTTAAVTAVYELNGFNAFDNTVSLPIVGPDGHVTVVGTRYNAGGGWPATDWDTGMHGIDVMYDFAEGTSTVTSDLDVRWRVASVVSSDLDARWRVFTPVTSDVDVRWRVSSATQSDFDARWRVWTGVTSDIACTWLVRSQVVSDLDARWITSARVNSDLTSRWVVLSNTVIVPDAIADLSTPTVTVDLSVPIAEVDLS